MSIFMVNTKMFPYLAVIVEKVPMGKGTVELVDC